MNIPVYPNIKEAWYCLLNDLLGQGVESSPRGKPTKELLGVSFRVTNGRMNLLKHPARKLSPRFAVAEWLWISSGSSDLELLAKYAPGMEKFSDDGKTLSGAYGPKIHAQRPRVLNLLREDPDTRQAVTSIWSPLPTWPSKDIPCTISWQLLNRGGKLHGIVNMRSSDVWLGLPYDFFSFSQLTNEYAAVLGLETGSLTFNLGSSHMYLENQGAAENVLSDLEALEVIESPQVNCIAPASILHEDDRDYPGIWKMYGNALDAPSNKKAYEILEDPGACCAKSIKKPERPSLDSYYLEMLKVVETRGTCPRRKVAAILVDATGKLVATGYNGTPAGMPHCTDHPCPGASDQSGDSSRCEAIHAEMNALDQAAASRREPHTLYCSTTPCFTCAKLLISRGVRHIVAASKYPDEAALELLHRAGIFIEVLA